ncbi:AAA family ATPase [Actinacidiphila oryziradicis]|uniref:helix-turn-helix transcriptional regulator n=1 Tax=Actinacidiphila oryziradicis TaxID=2571141 RepID=UPI0023F30D3C|nr:AAA family ATPase [Actinacidiphila oryziradicis]MCW2869482.1 ATPase-like protein [Actinacidiphila oryziradicis]
MFTSPARDTRDVPLTTASGRGHEFARLREALDRCLSGRGSVVTLHGSVGSGRTELLHTFSDFAMASGVRVLSAAGAPLEREFPLGVVRQLFQSADLDPEAEAEAARLLEDGVVEAQPPAWSSSAVTEPLVRPTVRTLHGLSTLALRLARRAPLLLAVDDRQDADVQSLESLLYLVRRTRNARVLTVLGSRETMTPPDPFFEVELARQPHHERVKLGLLPPAVVAALLRERLSDDAARRLAADAHALTGGNPLLVRALIEDQQETDPQSGLVVGENYRRGLMNCLHRIDPLALRCARGTAALGRPADPALLAELLLLAPESLTRALYLLNASGLFRDGAFRHPSGGGDLLAAMKPGELAALHHRAAQLLRGAGAPAGHVAEQMRAAEGQVRAPWAVTGEPVPQAPTTGEPPAGAAEPGEAGDDVVIQCVPWLPGTGTESQPTERQRLASLRYLFWHGRVEEGAAALERFDAEHPGSSEGSDELRTWLSYWYPSLLPAAEPTYAARARDREKTDGMRVLSTLLGGGSPDEAVLHAERIMRESRLGQVSLRSLTAALTVLMYADRADRAARWCTPVAEEARGGRNATWHALFSALTAESALRQGDLRGAEASARAAFLSIRPDGWGVAVGFPLSTMIAARTALGRHEDAARYLALMVPEAMFRTPAGLHYRYARGGYLLAVGKQEEALADFRACGDAMARWGMDHLPGLVPWRVGAARAQLALGRPHAARELADSQLARLGAGQGRVRGMALRLRAASAEPAERTGLFQQAVEALEASGDRLELSAALAELSTAHGAEGDPVSARTTERRARHVSRISRDDEPRSGNPVTDDATDELSDAERRVAELAAHGLTNREIARKLYITVSTVEQHLTRVYRKLGVRRRMELRYSLDPHRGLAG